VTLKAVIKRLAPPIALDLYRRLRSEPPRRSTWEGVYRHRRDVPSSGQGFDGRTWVAIEREAAESLLGRMRATRTIAEDAPHDRGLLGLLAALIGRRRGTVRVLDFGGGLGLDYLHLTRSLARPCEVDYHIVETREVCREGEQLFATDRCVHFHAALPALAADVDIVNINTALQYVDDYGALIKALCAYRPRYFLFLRLVAGDIPTYASAQYNMSGMVIPHWFFDVGQIVDLMMASGYGLLFKSASEQVLPQDNFPSRCRVGRACNLLFIPDGTG
jgi:putative methyltransferase (TIGR04325 family)